MYAILIINYEFEFTVLSRFIKPALAVSQTIKAE